MLGFAKGTLKQRKRKRRRTDGLFDCDAPPRCCAVLQEGKRGAGSAQEARRFGFPFYKRRFSAARSTGYGTRRSERAETADDARISARSSIRRPYRRAVLRGHKQTRSRLAEMAGRACRATLIPRAGWHGRGPLRVRKYPKQIRAEERTASIGSGPFPSEAREALRGTGGRRRGTHRPPRLGPG